MTASGLDRQRYAEHMLLLAQVVGPVKLASYERMRLQPGYRVLDLGCGPGIDTVALAQLLGPAGRVVGVDGSQAMVEAADQRAREAQVEQQVTHLAADAEALTGLERESFDAARSERLFQHLGHPERALAEMIRVTRPDRWVVLLDTDWTTASIDTPLVDIEQRLKGFIVHERIPNPTSGRQLNRLLRDQGLSDVAVEVLPLVLTDARAGRLAGALDAVERDALAAGVLTADELERWRTSLERAGEAGTFFMSINLVLAAGRKPVPRQAPG